MAIGRELLAIPAGLFMRTAELAGALVLRGWLVVWPVLQEAWRLLQAGLERAEREVTPARATVAVAIVAAICLGVSQFFDYRAVQIGTPEYAGVSTVAPAPKVDRADAGSAHLWLGLPLAALALAAIANAARGRVATARLLIPIGLAAVAISVFVDAPKGLDEGDATTIYAGAEATLETGFWAQLVSAVLLIALAFLLPRTLRGRGPRPGAKAGA
ncbi:MAG: hypothetical protein M3383_01315 [Actinomycetota bacterium]|nr:hypothetical protein [Actinomycetota bacterium]